MFLFEHTFLWKVYELNNHFYSCSHALKYRSVWCGIATSAIAIRCCQKDQNYTPAFQILLVSAVILHLTMMQHFMIADWLLRYVFCSIKTLSCCIWLKKKLRKIKALNMNSERWERQRSNAEGNINISKALTKSLNPLSAIAYDFTLIDLRERLTSSLRDLFVCMSLIGISKRP